MAKQQMQSIAIIIIVSISNAIIDERLRWTRNASLN